MRGGTTTNNLYGDALDMEGNTRGGNDTLTGGDGPGFIFGPFFGVTNNLYGDANVMRHSVRGGDDVLAGGDRSTNNLFGDANSMFEDSRGGDDTLIGGIGPGGPSSFMSLYGDALRCTTTPAAATTS